MDQVILSYLNKKNIKTPDSKFYSFIDEWAEWYKGENKFHHYKDEDGTERKIYNAGMGKQIAEDWASILLTERDTIYTKAVISGKEKVKLSKKSTEYLQAELKK